GQAMMRARDADEKRLGAGQTAVSIRPSVQQIVDVFPGRRDMASDRYVIAPVVARNDGPAFVRNSVGLGVISIKEAMDFPYQLPIEQVPRRRLLFLQLLLDLHVIERQSLFF